MPDAAAPVAALDAGSRARVLLAAALALAPLLLLLPAPAALADAGVALAVMVLSWQRPLPGWLRLLLALAMLAVVAATMGTRMGRDTGCALLAAMLAIKPAETAGLRDARSLLGFALFAPFAAFLLDQGPLTLLLGLAAALAVLLGLQRLADAEAQRPAAAFGPQLRGVARQAALGLPLALAAFWLFPRMATPLWGVPERAVAKPGLSDRMSPGGWLDLMNDDAPRNCTRSATGAARCCTTSTAPPGRRHATWTRRRRPPSPRPGRAGITGSKSSRPIAASWSRSTCPSPRRTAAACWPGGRWSPSARSPR